MISINNFISRKKMVAAVTEKKKHRRQEEVQQQVAILAKDMKDYGKVLPRVICKASGDLSMKGIYHGLK